MDFPKTLILATSQAPELRKPYLRPKEFPRTEYIALAERIQAGVLDYAIYDSPGWNRYRQMERRSRLDLHLAIAGYRRARSYDVVLLMSEQVAIPYMMLQKMMGRRAGTAYVSAHSSQKQANLVRRLSLFSNLDIAVANARAQEAFLTEQMGIPRRALRIVLYAVDETFYTPGKGGGGYVLTSGMSHRDYATLFDAVEGLPVRLKLAAGGRRYALNHRDAMPRPPENVEMLPRLDSAGMREMHQNAALLAVSVKKGRTDAAGCSVVLEAMCCARPVVASGTVGLAEYVTHGQSGYLAEPGSPDAMRAAIQRALDRRPEAEVVARRAREECEGRLSFNSLVGGLAEAVSDASDSGAASE